MGLSIKQLAVHLRVCVDISDELEEPYHTILSQLHRWANGVVDSRAPSAPDAARDEAIIQLAGYLFDKPPASRSAGYANAWEFSGSANILKAVDKATGDRARIIWDSFRGSLKRHGPSTYTDMRLADAEASVRGDGVDSNAIAAVQAAAGQWARAFAVATVEPAVPATRMLTAGVLHDLGRSLVLQGEAVYLIDQGGRRAATTSCC